MRIDRGGGRVSETNRLAGAPHSTVSPRKIGVLAWDMDPLYGNAVFMR